MPSKDTLGISMEPRKTFGLEEINFAACHTSWISAQNVFSDLYALSMYHIMVIAFKLQALVIYLTNYSWKFYDKYIQLERKWTQFS